MVSKWETKKLGELTINYDGKRKPVKESERKKGQFPYYGASGIVDYVDDYLFDGEYLLIAEDGENLRSRNTPIAFLAKNRFWVNNHAHIVTGNTLAETKFLMYALLNADINPYLTGAVMPKLTQGNLNQIELACPPIETQKSIVHILGTLDDKIALNREMNKTLEAIAQAIFKSWFVDFEPFRDGEFVESELGMIPMGWEVKSLTEDFVITMGQSPDGKTYNENGEGIPFFQGRTDFGFRFPSNRIYCTDPKRYAKKFDTLVSVRAPVGDMNIAINDCCIGRGLSAVRHKKGYYSFTYYLLKSIDEKFKQFEHNGTVFGSINKTSFENLKVIIPIEALICDFEKIVNAIDDQIHTLSGESKTLSNLRDSLLPKLLSGEIDITKKDSYVTMD